MLLIPNSTFHVTVSGGHILFLYFVLNLYLVTLFKKNLQGEIFFHPVSTLLYLVDILYTQ